MLTSCAVCNDYSSSCDCGDTEPVRERQALAEKQHGEDRDEDDRQLVDGGDAGSIPQLQRPEIVNPGTPVAGPKRIRKSQLLGETEDGSCQLPLM